MYLKAAWLFLTARVVHRTLLQEDEDMDQSWNDYGIDVSVRFTGRGKPSIADVPRTGANTACPAAVGHRLTVPFPNHTQSDALVART